MQSNDQSVTLARYQATRPIVGGWSIQPLGLGSMRASVATPTRYGNRPARIDPRRYPDAHTSRKVQPTMRRALALTALIASLTIAAPAAAAEAKPTGKHCNVQKRAHQHKHCPQPAPPHTIVPRKPYSPHTIVPRV